MTSYSQPFTGRSIATGSDDSDPVVTPFDDLPTVGRGAKAGVQGAVCDGVQIRSPSNEYYAHHGIRSSFRMDEGQPMGYRSYEAGGGSYFPPPRGQVDTPPVLNRRGTTKDLIGRFESLEDSSTIAPTRRRRQASTTSRGSNNMTTNVDSEKAKERGKSPIRQSFRNLLSVFKKHKPAHKEQPALSPVPSVPGTRYKVGGSGSPASVQGPPTPSKPALALHIPPSAPGLAQTDPRNCSSPVSAHTGKQGALLHLSRPPPPADGGPPVPPVWVACAAQLHTTHILVSWTTAGGNPASRLVPFTACSDVRSLALGELREDERALLPEGRDVRVFELLFEGRARERFAAGGVAERAGWVSAIWDAVLLAQENRVRSPAVTESVYAPSPIAPPAREPVAERHTPVDEPPTDNAPTTSSRISHVSSASVNRALPAIPAHATSKPPLPRLNLRDLPPAPVREGSQSSTLSPLPKPPVTPTSVRGSPFLTPPRTGSPGPARTPSPSIRNLDQRSVVKQRLAQIAQGAAPAPASPSPSSRRQEVRDGARTRRRGSAASAAASILDAYARADSNWDADAVGSPRSLRSGRLTTAPVSPVGSPPPPGSARSRMRRADQDLGAGRGQFLALPAGDGGVFSPASRYSDDGGAGFGELAVGGAGAQMRSALEALAIPLPKSTMAAAAGEDVQDGAGAQVEPIIQDIREGVEALKGRSATDSTNIVNIRTKVDEVLSEVRRLRPQDGTSGEGEVVTVKLEQVRVDIKDDLAKLRDVVDGLPKNGMTAGEATTGAVPPDVVELHEKLDNLLRVCQSKVDPAEGDAAEARAAATNELVEVLVMLKDAEEQRAAQMEQQTDSIRYLNQLNTWLEAFVQHGTSQIEGVAAGVQQLCQDLGPVPELQDGEQSEDGSPCGSLLSDIRKFLVQHKEREENTASMQTSVNGLIAAVQEDLRRNAEARNLFTTESVIGMIDRQRQDQERMLKALATELSNDIRGERLRFVEAMKEATAINVQIHVEEFKKELTREVMLMTQEVTRLQRERQGLEQQIADLFAFYAKQKQAGKVSMVGGDGGALCAYLASTRQIVDAGRMPVQVVQGHPGLTLMPPGARPPSQMGYRRPLPSPTPSPTR
ncbi:hypothetical protein BD413DRAFT_643915 [Trametes elegans]|nr:hypothetical protein BD413DRAFT_643915 [Trametes elegans]